MVAAEFIKEVVKSRLEADLLQGRRDQILGKATDAINDVLHAVDGVQIFFLGFHQVRRQTPGNAAQLQLQEQQRLPQVVVQVLRDSLAFPFLGGEELRCQVARVLL